MKKGIIFTTDAILALVAVIILLAMVPMQAGGEKVFENLENQARDRAITSFYKATAGNGSIGAGARFGKCAVYYGLNPDNGLAVQAQPQENIFCEEA